jgi:hypothetical protein
MKETRIFNGKKYILDGIYSKSEADSQALDLKVKRFGVRIIKSNIGRLPTRYAVYRSMVLKKPYKCPKCGSRNTEPSWGSHGYLQCNKCGVEF